MTKRTLFILKTMNIIFWVIFLGLCIVTGSLLYSFLVSVFSNPSAAKNLYLGLDLSQLMAFNMANYYTMVLMIIVVAGLKALLFYFIIKIPLKMRIEQPFSIPIQKLMLNVSYVAFLVGICLVIADKYAGWLIEKGINLIKIEKYVYGGSAFLFLGAVIFFVAHLFKKGIELQTENELTV
jgi:hypothetical protein